MDLTDWMGRNGFFPHGYCFTWDSGLLWTMVGADALIALAYYSIPVALVVLVRKRADFSLNWVVLLFSLFIFACGTTHVMDIWTIWVPDYRLQAATKVVTALVSAATAVVLWPLLPRAIALPSVTALQEAIGRLASEIEVRRSTENALVQARGSLHMALSALDAGFISTDLEGRVVQMNAVAERVTGFDADSARGLPIFSVWRVVRHSGMESESVSSFVARHSEARDGGHLVRIRTRDGRILPLSVSSSRLESQPGASSGMAILFKDRSPALKAEADAQRLAAMVDSSADAIISTTLGGTIVSWNRAAEIMFGYDAVQAIGRPISWLVPEGEHAGLQAAIAVVLRGERPVPQDVGRITKAGDSIDVSELVSPVEDGEGQLVGLSYSIRDTSAHRRAEQLRLERELLVAENEQMQEAGRLKNMFVANMSHELRTPLNSVIGFSQLLQMDDGSLDLPQRRQYLEFIHSSGKHLLRLINDVLDFSKVESGTFDFYPEDVRLRELVEDAVSMVKPVADAGGVQVDFEVATEPQAVFADPARLKQVLINYLSNAIKFSGRGTTVRVKVGPDAGDCFRIEVHDEGIGISQADISKLFVEFQQLDSGEAKRYQGTGLGLALTRKLVEAQGGKVWVESEVGSGSSFYASLPNTSPTPSPMRRPTAAFTGSGQVPLVEQPRLLVVDEDDQRRLVVAKHGEDAGFTVAKAATHREALQYAGDGRFDAVSLSFLLQESVGASLLSTMRMHRGVDDPVAVFIVPPATVAPPAFRVHDILPKPFEPEQIGASLRRLGLLKEPADRPTILVVDDDLSSLALMGQTLAELGVNADLVEDARRALEYLYHQTPSAIVLDLMMPEMDGFQLLDELRRRPSQSVPVIVWTAVPLSSVERSRLIRSADDFTASVPSRADSLQQVLREAATTSKARKEKGA